MSAFHLDNDCAWHDPHVSWPDIIVACLIALVILAAASVLLRIVEPPSTPHAIDPGFSSSSTIDIFVMCHSMAAEDPCDDTDARRD